ncbi:MAG: PIN domain-containing protein [Candidatus Riflebacteria bacterium]|nr:PIN domain-containing protein [Candidatus Riflebacteria bacterium]
MAMMAANRAFIDTNILVHLKLERSPFFQRIFSQIETLKGQNIELWISRQILREYLAVMTRPIAERKFTVQELARDICGGLPVISGAPDRVSP